MRTREGHAAFLSRTAEERGSPRPFFVARGQNVIVVAPRALQADEVGQGPAGDDSSYV